MGRTPRDRQGWGVDLKPASDSLFVTAVFCPPPAGMQGIWQRKSCDLETDAQN